MGIKWISGYTVKCIAHVLDYKGSTVLPFVSVWQMERFMWTAMGLDTYLRTHPMDFYSITFVKS